MNDLAYATALIWAENNASGQFPDTFGLAVRQVYDAVERLPDDKYTVAGKDLVGLTATETAALERLVADAKFRPVAPEVANALRLLVRLVSANQ